MELNEKELENILGGANPNVINKHNSNSDEISEEQLENVHAGMYKRELAESIAQDNSELYRREMIQKLEEEKAKLLEEKGTLKK